jgi:two-component system NtrC family sensor kinase
LEKKYSDMKASAFWIFAGVTAAGGVLALLVAIVLALSVVNPVAGLTRAVKALQSGDYDFQYRVHTRDEIGLLGDAFWQMRSELRDTYAKLKGKIEAADEDLKQAYRELKEKQQQLIHTEKLASMGQLSAGVAHEINNPLGTILLYSHALLRGLESGHVMKPDLEMVVSEATRCREIVRNLLDFARQSRLSPIPTDLAGLVDEVLTLMTVQTRGTDVRLTHHVSEDVPELMIDPIQIKQVLVNLVDNALDALAGHGQVHVSAHLNDKGDAVEIRVSDNGCGIVEESLSRLFTPFFTTKPEGKGTGLGLAVAYGIVKMHRGDITVKSEKDKGTTFLVVLPTDSNGVGHRGGQIHANERLEIAGGG